MHTASVCRALVGWYMFTSIWTCHSQNQKWMIFIIPWCALLPAMLRFGHGGRKYFFQKGRNSGFFQVVLVNFHFIHSKLRKQPFLAKRLSEKCQIPKYRGEKSPLTSFRRPWFYVLIEATNIFYSPRCQQCTKVTLWLLSSAFTTFSCFSSMKAATKPIHVWKIWRRTCVLTPGKNPTCASSRHARRRSATHRTGQSIRTGPTPTRYKAFEEGCVNWLR